MSAPLLASSDDIEVKQGQFHAGGSQTDIVVHNFEDKIFIVITQLQKLGTLILVSKDIAVEDISRIPTYSSKILLGKDEEFIHVLARTLVADQDINKPVLFAVALKNHSPKTLRDILENISKFKVW